MLGPAPPKAEIAAQNISIATNTFQLNILNKVEKSAADHKQKEMRARARLMLEIADNDSAQFKWYGKLQVSGEADVCGGSGQESRARDLARLRRITGCRGETPRPPRGRRCRTPPAVEATFF
jgi:hypothetical protein